MKLKILLTFLLFTTIGFGQKQLHLYVGQNKDVYSACLTCSEIDREIRFGMISAHMALI